MGDTGEHPWARLDVPGWLFGGDPKELFRIAGLICRTDGSGGATARLVTTEEAYKRRPPSLVDARQIVLSGGGVAPTSSPVIASLIHDEFDRPALESVRDRVDGELARLTGNPLVVASHTARLKISTALGHTELAHALTSGVDALNSFILEGTGERALGHIDAWAVLRDVSLNYRLRLMVLLLRLGVDPRLAAGDTATVKSELQQTGSAFKSSEYLFRGTMLLDSYLGPLVSSLTPGVWGVLCPRASGTVVISLGRAVAGTARVPHSMLDAVSKFSAAGNFRSESFSRADSPRGAIIWWASALNDLFGWMTDPGVFVDANGAYDVLAQLETVASVEQVFRRVLSIQTLHSDTTARTSLMFGAMDTLETLLQRGQSTLYSHDHAKKTLARLKSSLGADEEVLLPAASRAVLALGAVGDGFFMREADGRVQLREGQDPVSREEAATQYLGMLRDAGHGFGSPSANRWEVDANLMVRHTGNIPHDLALLPWLYLLDMLAEPAQVRGNIGRRNAKRIRT